MKCRLNEIYMTLNLGMHNENILKGVQGFVEKFLDKIEVLYLPLRTGNFMFSFRNTSILKSNK